MKTSLTRLEGISCLFSLKIWVNDSSAGSYETQGRAAEETTTLLPLEKRRVAQNNQGFDFTSSSILKLARQCHALPEERAFREVLLVCSYGGDTGREGEGETRRGNFMKTSPRTATEVYSERQRCFLMKARGETQRRLNVCSTTKAQLAK